MTCQGEFLWPKSYHGYVKLTIRPIDRGKVNSASNWGSGGREFESLHPDHFLLHFHLYPLNEHGLVLRGDDHSLQLMFTHDNPVLRVVCVPSCVPKVQICVPRCVPAAFRRLGPQWTSMAFAARGRAVTAVAKKIPDNIYSFSAPDARSGGRDFCQFKTP